jgi:hypothetical protein
MSKRIYGKWAGDPQGRQEDVLCCIEEVWSNERWSPRGYQCQRKRGHGPNGLFCKQHGRMALGKLTRCGADWFKAAYKLPAEEEIKVVELSA